MWFQRRRFLEIHQSETRIACGPRVGREILVTGIPSGNYWEIPSWIIL
jgi:hypothetical protein